MNPPVEGEGEIELSVSSDDLAMILACLSYIVAKLDDFYFHPVIGADREAVDGLYERLAALRDISPRE